MKIGIYIQDEDLRKKMEELALFRSSFLVYELKSVKIEDIKDLKIDLLIFDFFGNESEQLRYFQKIKTTLNIKGICVIHDYSEAMVEEMLKYSIRDMADDTQSMKAFYVQILLLLKENEQLSISLYEQIHTICRQHHLLTHLKGYDFVHTAVQYYIENENKSFRMKDVYDTIAKKYHTTSSRVEKNMRMVIRESGSVLSNAKFIDVCYREWLNG